MMLMSAAESGWTSVVAAQRVAFAAVKVATMSAVHRTMLAPFTPPFSASVSGSRVRARPGKNRR